MPESNYETDPSAVIREPLRRQWCLRLQLTLGLRLRFRFFGSERVRYTQMDVLLFTLARLPALHFRVNWSISQPRNCLDVGTAHECLLAT